MMGGRRTGSPGEEAAVLRSRFVASRKEQCRLHFRAVPRVVNTHIIDVVWREMRMRTRSALQQTPTGRLPGITCEEMIV